MPNVKTVSVTYERKFNLGDFNSAHIGITVWADTEKGDDLNDVMNRLWDMAKGNVKAQAMPLVANHKAEVEQIFLGLPIKVREEITNGDEQ